MKKSLFNTVVAVFLVALVGCDVAPTKQKSLDGCVAIIDGRSFITTNDVRSTIMMEMMGLEKRKGAFPRQVKDSFLLKNAQKVFNRLIAQRLIDLECQDESIETDEAIVATNLAKYVRFSKAPGTSPDKIADNYGEYRDLFIERFNTECRLLTLFERSGEARVTDWEIGKYKDAVKETIRKSTLVNERAKSVGAEIYSKLLDGADWQKIAEEYTEDDDSEYARHWETIDLENFHLEVVVKALTEKKSGDFTKPLDTPEGMMIVRVDERAGTLCKCSRIYLKMADIPAPATDAEAMAALRSSKYESFQKDLLERLREKYKIEYPLGADYFKRQYEASKKNNRKKNLFKP